MREYLDQVRRAAQSELYFVTLGAALVIPDMCAALEADDGRTCRTRYETWFDRHMAPKYTVGPEGTPSFSGEDCYGLRCAMLHQGRLEPHKGEYKRIVFIEPNPVIAGHNNVIGEMLNLDVVRFALDMVASAETWLAGAEHTPEFAANSARYVQRYPKGIGPFNGIPVIA